MKEKTFFGQGGIITGGKEFKLEDIQWTPHPVFKGVLLKNIIKGEETGKRLSCHLVKIEPGCELGSHVHEGKMELHEVVGGSGKCIISEETFDYSPGIVSYIPDNVKHSVKAGSDGLYILAKFSPALI